MSNVLGKGELEVKGFPNITVKKSDGTEENGKILISDRRFLFLTPKANSQFSIAFQFSQDQLKSADSKTQKKLSKDNPTTANSKSVLRLKIDSKNYDFTITGDKCNTVIQEIIDEILNLKKREIVIADTADSENQSEGLTALHDLIRDNPILKRMVFDERFDFKSIVGKIFNQQLIQCFAKNKERYTGYSSHDLCLTALKSDTSAGANVTRFNFDPETIHQLLRRRPKLSKDYTAKSKDPEAQKNLLDQYIQKSRNKIGHNEDNQDITQHNERKVEERLSRIDPKCRLDDIFDDPIGHGVLRKDELRPDDMYEVKEINNHTQLVLMEMGVVPDTTTQPKSVHYKEVPIAEPENLTDLVDEPEQHFDHISAKQQENQAAAAEPDPKDFVQESSAESEQWAFAVKNFDSQLENLQKRRETGEQKAFVIDETGCKNVLYEMGYDKGAAETFAMRSKEELLPIAIKTAELQFLAAAYWDAKNTKKEENAEKLKAIIAEHRDQTLPANESDYPDDINMLYDNLKQMYDPILNGVRRVLNTGASKPLIL